MTITIGGVVLAAALAALVYYLLGRFTALPGGWVMFFTLLVLLLVYSAAPGVLVRIGA